MMLPSLDLRLASMMRAVEDVILPALASDGGIATEQAGLLLAHLGVIRDQLDDAPTFERLELTELTALSRALAEAATGGAETQAAADALSAELRQFTGEENVQTKIARFRHLVCRLVEASGRDGSPEFEASSSRLVIDYARRAALRERSWFGAMGFEAEGTQLLSRQELFSA